MSFGRYRAVLIRDLHSWFETLVQEQPIMRGFIYTIVGADAQLPEKVEGGNNLAWTDVDAFTIYRDDAMELAQKAVKQCTANDVVRRLCEESLIMNNPCFICEGGERKLPADMANTRTWITNWLSQHLCMIRCDNTTTGWAQYSPADRARLGGLVSRAYQCAVRVLHTFSLVVTVDYDGEVATEVSITTDATGRRAGTALVAEIDESESKILYFKHS
jgi:hypothetical protein